MLIVGKRKLNLKHYHMQWLFPGSRIVERRVQRLSINGIVWQSKCYWIAEFCLCSSINGIRKRHIWGKPKWTYVSVRYESNSWSFFIIVMDESTRRRISRVLYDALNQQGYSAGRIKYRSKTFSRSFKHILSKALNNDHIKCIFAGSFGEGISKLCSSDVDVMYSLSDIICVDERSHANGQYSLVLQNEYTDTFPGYVRLRADRPVRDHQRGLFSQRCIHTGKHYLSSLITMQAR